MPNRPNLVIVRSGDSSLHSRWLANPEGQPRTWDLIVNYFGNDPDKYLGGDWRRIDSKGPKWPALHELLINLGDTVKQYEYIWLPDDDLDCNCDDINRLFDICRRYRLSLAQPSLTPNSYISHMITRHNALFRLRFTSMVEIMAPCFDRNTLMELLPTFSENLSGWGLDSLWPKLIQDRGGSIAIIDDVQIRHTRPIGTANYGALAANGLTAQGEMRELLRRYNLPKPRAKVWGGVPKFLNKTLRVRVLLWPLLASGILIAGNEGQWSRTKYFRAWLGFVKRQVFG
jgi:hypothetical protein